MATSPDRPNPREDTADETPVTAHNSSPDRTVFTEEGNADAWIATDLTVELRE